MSADTGDDAIANTSDFEAAIGDILATAVSNGVDVRGSWVCNTDDGREDWEVMIYALAGEKK